MDNKQIDKHTPFLDALKKGEASGLRHFYGVFYKPMCFYLEKMQIDPFIIEEIVQDVFLKLWEKRTDFDHVLSIRGFLYTCCRNAALNYIEKEKRTNAKLTPIEEGTQIIDWTPDNQMIYIEMLREIHQAISELPAQCKNVMELLLMEDKSPEEVAQYLGITRSTVYNQKKRGVSLLQSKLNPDQFFALLLLICALR